jgi:hypothetical protein
VSLQDIFLPFGTWTKWHITQKASQQKPSAKWCHLQSFFYKIKKLTSEVTNPTKQIQIIPEENKQNQLSGSALDISEPRRCSTVVFLLAKYCQMAIFFSKMLILAIFVSKTHFLISKNFIQFNLFSSIWANISSNYDDSIQFLDERAALFISLVPHARWMKIYRKSTAVTTPKSAAG